MTPADMDGMVIGPVTHAVDGERIAAFVEAAGDVPERWVGVAPPGYAAVLLKRRGFQLSTLQKAVQTE